jgi:hypothetical protein
MIDVMGSVLCLDKLLQMCTVFCQFRLVCYCCVVCVVLCCEEEGRQFLRQEERPRGLGSSPVVCFGFPANAVPLPSIRPSRA